MFYTRLNQIILPVFIFLALSLNVFYCDENASNDASGKNSNSKMWIFQLPNTSKPLNYILRISSYPSYKEPYFKGYLKIFTLILKETDEIILHSKNLDVRSVYMGCYAKFKLDSINEIVRIQACRKLQANQTVELTISYYGFFNESSVGFYRSAYRIKNTVTFIVATQFKPTFARMAFPCYDEPKFKATFTLYISRTSGQRSISSMRLITTQYDYYNSPSYVDKYEQSPAMSTHSLAFAIFEYQCEDSGNRIRTCTRENVSKNAFHIYSIANKALNFMESYTDQKYHLSRIQFVTIPEHDVAVLENWGLVTFRESRMLFDDEASSEKHLEICTLAVCRGIAGQWFGNYLTTAWWDNVWLNEGFTSYFQLLLADQLYPSWRIKDSSILHTLQPALFADQVRIHHPLTVLVNSPNEINNIFDTISYRKGAAVIRMLEHIVSPELFQKSIRQCLKVGGSDNYGIVTPELMWRIFDEIVEKFKKPIHLTVSQIMNKWISNPGYPIVNVDRVTSRSAIKVHQIPFKSPRSAILPPKSETEWIIPFTYTKKSVSDFSSTMPTFWLLPSDNTTKPATLNDASLLPDEWIISNIQATGYYRVNYDLYNWKLLSQQLREEHDKIHFINRAQLIDDSVALAVDEYLPFSVPFELMTYLDKEQDMIPWFSALNKFDHLYPLYELTEAGPLLKKYILDRIKSVYTRLGFAVESNDDHLTKTARSAVLEIACRLDMPECLEEAVTRYRKHSVNLSKVSPDVKKTVLCAAVKYLTKEPVWMNIWNAYRKSDVAHDKEIFLYALGCTNDEELLKRYLHQLTHENDLEIRRQDYDLIFGAIFNRAVGVNSGLQFIYQLLPSMGYGILSSRTEDLMIRMLHFMKFTINTENQVTRVENMIMEVEQWDEGMPKDFTNALHSAHQAGLHQLTNRNRQMSNLMEALGGGKSDVLVEYLSSGYSLMFVILPTVTVFSILGYRMSMHFRVVSHFSREKK